MDWSGGRGRRCSTSLRRCARPADRILVLEEGRQVGLGTHRSLLDTCPTYREIWASQAPEEEGEDGTR